ncbi:MAG: hypothetical protein H5U37_07265, partial [Caldisericia bacterium]|nr:hypothetical protein [Caldisericia bacterium]
NSIDIDKNNPDIVIAGTDGGVYISFNGGNSWLNYGLSNIKKVLISSDSKTIYALKDQYLFKSNNYGKTWTDITPKFNETYYILISMNIDPFNSSKLFLSYYSRSKYMSDLYYSLNNGENWYKSNLPILNQYCRINDIKVDPSNKSIVYLTTWYNGILISNDGGQNFKLSEFTNPSTNEFLYQIEISKFNNSIIYISTFNSLFKSINKGITWERIYEGNQITQFLLDVLQLNNIYVTTYGGDGIIKSKDNGENWLISNKGIESNRIFSIVMNNNINIQSSSGFYFLNINEWENKAKKFPSYYGPHFFYIDYKGKFIQNSLNKNELFWFYYYYGNIIVYSNDNGLSWSLINKPNFNCEFDDIDIDFINRKIYAIFYDYNINKYQIYKGNFNSVWEKIDFNGITDFYQPIIRVDNKNPQVLYIGMSTYWEKDSSGNWVIKGGGIYKSTDSGKNWKLISLKETDVY